MTNAPAKPKRAYIYVEMTIRNPDRYKEYTKLSAPAVQAAGGRYLVAGVHPEVIEGEFDAHRVVIVEFESLERARAFYHSDGYQAAKQKRRGAADFKLLLLEG
jgi:uncharacterized protein (DUF1330 family)